MKTQDSGLLPAAVVGGEGEQALLLYPETGLPRESDMPAVLSGASGSEEVQKEAQVKMKYVSSSRS